jgi:hypothetical protein
MIKVQDIVYVAHRAPDLELHAQFLRDFGMVEVARTAIQASFVPNLSQVPAPRLEPAPRGVVEREEA